MMTMRIATLAALLAVPAVGLAAPASADLLDGTYQVTRASGSKTWVVSPCGAGCKRVEVSGASAAQEYHLQGGTWTFTTPSGATVYTIDDASLTGSVGIPGDAPEETYQLVKVG